MRQSVCQHDHVPFQRRSIAQVRFVAHRFATTCCDGSDRGMKIFSLMNIGLTHTLKASTHSHPVDLSSRNNQPHWKLRGDGCTQSAVCQPGRGKRTSQHDLSLTPNLQIPLFNKPTRKSLNLQPRKRSIQIPLREIIPSLSRSNEHLQLDTTCSVALDSRGSEFCAEAVDVVDNVRLEALS